MPLDSFKRAPTLKSILIDCLDDLAQNQLKRFCQAILDRNKEVKRKDLTSQESYDIADALVSIFTESGAIDVAVETLKVLNFNQEAKKLAETAHEVLSTSDSRYGDFMKIKTTGASLETAQQDKLGFAGVTASIALAKTDLPFMEKYKASIKSVGTEQDVDPAIIAALISRGCRAGQTLKDGWGAYDPETKKYNTFGLMQINVDPKGGAHVPRGSWDSEEHISQGIDILIHFINRIHIKFPKWSDEERLKGGIAAYCIGDGEVHSFANMDDRTAGKDYSNDVVARAQWFKSHGGF
ncbi:lysozyme g-like [Genypterus blacodes]|uniref:lysozyme g-like n=1 Tax=Genypterus blacodes TaxID=154954 RepID=UPI003F75A444